MSQSIADFHKLSLAERIQLVEDLWDSIAADSPETLELTRAHREEIQLRLEAHDADPSTAIPWQQVRTELFKRNH